jgi:hypothetical protein
LAVLVDAPMVPWANNSMPLLTASIPAETALRMLTREPKSRMMSFRVAT